MKRSSLIKTMKKKRKVVLVRVLYQYSTHHNSLGYMYPLWTEDDTRYYIVGPRPIKQWLGKVLAEGWNHTVRRGDMLILENVKKSTWRIVDEEREVRDKS
jgi:hypothetical protein